MFSHTLHKVRFVLVFFVVCAMLVGCDYLIDSEYQFEFEFDTGDGLLTAIRETGNELKEVERTAGEEVRTTIQDALDRLDILEKNIIENVGDQLDVLIENLDRRIQAKLAWIDVKFNQIHNYVLELVQAVRDGAQQTIQRAEEGLRRAIREVDGAIGKSIYGFTASGVLLINTIAQQIITVAGVLLFLVFFFFGVQGWLNWFTTRRGRLLPTPGQKSAAVVLMLLTAATVAVPTAFLFEPVQAGILRGLGQASEASLDKLKVITRSGPEVYSFEPAAIVAFAESDTSTLLVRGSRLFSAGQPTATFGETSLYVDGTDDQLSIDIGPVNDNPLGARSVVLSWESAGTPILSRSVPVQTPTPRPIIEPEITGVNPSTILRGVTQTLTVSGTALLQEANELEIAVVVPKHCAPMVGEDIERPLPIRSHTDSQIVLDASLFNYVSNADTCVYTLKLYVNGTELVSQRRTLNVDVPTPTPVVDLYFDVAPHLTSSSIEGETTRISLRIKNQGNSRSSDFVVKWTDSEGMATLQAVRIPALGPGEASQNVSLGFAFGRTGIHDTTVSIDPDGAIVESSKANNAYNLRIDVFADIPLVVAPPGLTVGLGIDRQVYREATDSGWLEIAPPREWCCYDYGRGSGQGFSWWTTLDSASTTVAEWKLPPGVVLGLWHYSQGLAIPTVFGQIADRFDPPNPYPYFLTSARAEDDQCNPWPLTKPFTTPTNHCWHWFVSTGYGFDWQRDQAWVNRLPRGTVVGLMFVRSGGEEGAFTWGATRYNALKNNGTPPGFARRCEVDLGAGDDSVCWFEKVTGVSIVKQQGSNVGVLGIGMDQNTDRPGGDYMTFITGSTDPKICQAYCYGDPRCRAWNFRANVQRCWLKNTVPQAVSSTGAVSGVTR